MPVISNSSAKTPGKPSISEVLFRGSHRSFDNFAIVPSNVAAVETASHLASGIQTFGVIIGPSGWGKSHILDCVETKFRDQGLRNIRSMSAIEWLSGTHSADPAAPLLLDDVHEVTNKARLRIQLRLALERRVKANRPTLLSFTAPKRTRLLNGVLPSPKHWSVGVISEPAPSERVVILNILAAREGLSLSTALAHLIASRMRGNGCTMVGALKRLRLDGALWNDVRGTLKACGVLEPFFADCGNWDLQRHIIHVAKQLPLEELGVDSKQLVAYTMLREASLCEDSVARALRITPGQVYGRAAAFEKSLQQSEQAALAVRQFSETVVDALLNE